MTAESYKRSPPPGTRQRKHPARRRRPAQEAFDFPTRGRGGKRKGAGRKPVHPRLGGRAPVDHVTRATFSSHHPLHVTLRVRPDVWNLRTGQTFAAVLEALRGGKQRFGAQLVHFSVQENHLHLLVEARDRVALARFMKGLAVRIARRVNRFMRRRGPVFADRYHAAALESPTRVRNALLYVLNNRRRHLGPSRQPPPWWLDPCSSALDHEHWQPVDEEATRLCLERARRVRPPPGEGPVMAPRTWLLGAGWLERAHVPRGASRLLDRAAVPGPL